MSSAKERGKLIVFDGADGVGKHTQTTLLVEALRLQNKRVETIDFPQYDRNLAGMLIKECLRGLHGDFLAVDPYIASVVYATDRFESKAKLEKWLDAGVYVILDRYVSANQMHQGAKIRDEDDRAKYLEWIERLEYDVFKLPRPDIVLYLDVPSDTSSGLIDSRGAKDAAEKNENHQRMTREVAMELIEDHPTWERIICTEKDRLLTREEIHENILEALQENKII